MAPNKEKLTEACRTMLQAKVTLSKPATIFSGNLLLSSGLLPGDIAEKAEEVLTAEGNEWRVPKDKPTVPAVIKSGDRLVDYISRIISAPGEASALESQVIAELLIKDFDKYEHLTFDSANDMMEKLPTLQILNQLPSLAEHYALGGSLRPEDKKRVQDVLERLDDMIAYVELNISQLKTESSNEDSIQNRLNPEVKQDLITQNDDIHNSLAQIKALTIPIAESLGIDTSAERKRET